ncbi:hypothetical protein QYE76_025484 [Lolium multiflorum]|uniref:DUF6598 domain-containing protein n=1 Tax=Lolium multiflorum TaxID=4521 RepID=A0AAD8VUB4_LOLMU|nr:hypothetical protein QYE76_025484 [Lolium multiflorum]
MAGVSSDSEARIAKVKKIQDRMAMTKAFLQRQQKLPTKKKANDDESADPSSTNLVAIQDNHLDKGKSALAKKTSDEEAVDYAWYRLNWESNCCKNCDYFENLTVLSSMQFTHYTPGIIPYNSAGAAVDTLQIFSMKLKLTDDIAGGFELPLSVYGVVAVRDTVDSSRNILFSCDRTMAQELTQDDPFLHLTGPSRAVVSIDTVYFEIQLKVKGAADSQDNSLITCARGYTGGCGSGISTLCFKNIFCTLELCLQPFKRTVQATILTVQIVKKKDLWPLNFAYGGLVACTPLPRTTMVSADSGVSSNQIVLIESKGRPMPKGVNGHVHLWRQVVSVERGGGLDVVIQAYSKSGAVHVEGRVHFTSQTCSVSQQECVVGEAQVTVAVAWSLVPDDLDDVVSFQADRGWVVGKPEDFVTKVGKAEAPVTEAGKAEESVTEILKAQESDQEASAVKVKKIQESMAMKKAFLHSQDKLPTKKKAKAKDEESADSSTTNSMTIQDNHLDKGKSALAKKTADEEAADYAWYRLSWESNCCKNCDHFENSTVLSSMLFTHYTPGIIPYNSAGAAVDTLQIFSMQLKLTDDIAGSFELPLSVYGVVAVRDTLDSRRNILFSCDRTMAQELTQDDPFLHLTGPSRAIVSMDTVYFEIELKVKGAADSQDKSLITCAQGYTGGCGPGISTLCLKNVFCMLELCSQPVKRTVQATILSIQIIKKKELWPKFCIWRPGCLHPTTKGDNGGS